MGKGISILHVHVIFELHLIGYGAVFLVVEDLVVARYKGGGGHQQDRQSLSEALDMGCHVLVHIYCVFYVFFN